MGYDRTQHLWTTASSRVRTRCRAKAHETHNVNNHNLIQALLYRKIRKILTMEHNRKRENVCILCVMCMYGEKYGEWMSIKIGKFYIMPTGDLLKATVFLWYLHITAAVTVPAVLVLLFSIWSFSKILSLLYGLYRQLTLYSFSFWLTVCWLFTIRQWWLLNRQCSKCLKCSSENVRNKPILEFVYVKNRTNVEQQQQMYDRQW